MSKEFRPSPMPPEMAIKSLKDSTIRAVELSRIALQSADEEPLIRLRAEKGVYLDCLKRLRDGVVQRRTK